MQYKTREQKRQFYNSKSWRHMREAIKQRDNYKCQECTWLGFVKTGRKKIQLAADHINVLEEYPELALDEGNLETLVERKPTK